MGNKQSHGSDTSKKHKSGLVIKTSTWNKDSHSLYDYESQKQIKKDFIPISTTCNIVRVGDEVRTETQNENEQGFQLSVNDYFKIGRVRFRVKELSYKNQNVSGQNTINDQSDTKEYFGENKESCRICLSDTYTQKNRFIQPCNCSGTVAYVHEECLQQWLKSKIHCKETAIHSYYSMKNLECELCKFKYTDENSFVGKNFENVLISKPNCPYLMLELLSKEKSVVRAIQLIKYEKISQIVLGRGSDSDIRISDISVSREHAIVRLENNKFIIEDQKSKFGTLILIQKPIELNPSFNKIEVQIGRSVCYFQVKKQTGIMTSCCSGKGQKKNDVINSTVISKATQAEFMENDARINVSNQYLGDEEQKNQDEQSSPTRINNHMNRQEGMNQQSPFRNNHHRGGAMGTRQIIPDTMQHIFATNQLIQQPQTVDDLNRIDDIQINLNSDRQSNNNHNYNNHVNLNVQSNNSNQNDIQESHPQQIPTFVQNYQSLSHQQQLVNNQLEQKN